MNALANPEVGKYLEKYFVASFQRVGTFRIVGAQKQGGNVAAYFCAPDGRVLHSVAGPVSAEQFLAESKWIVGVAQKGIEVAKGDGAKFKAHLRAAHAEKLKNEFGMVVEAVTFDPPVDEDNTGALTYRDPTGRPLAPKLPPPPIDGPNVKLDVVALQAREAKDANRAEFADRRGGRWVLGTQGRVHLLMASHSLQPIERIYGSVFEGILGERISTQPVQIVNPFPWHGRAQKGG